MSLCVPFCRRWIHKVQSNRLFCMQTNRSAGITFLLHILLLNLSLIQNFDGHFVLCEHMLRNLNLYRDVTTSSKGFGDLTYIRKDVCPCICLNLCLSTAVCFFGPRSVSYV